MAVEQNAIPWIRCESVWHTQSLALRWWTIPPSFVFWIHGCSPPTSMFSPVPQPTATRRTLHAFFGACQLVKYASVPGNPIWDLQFGVHLVQKMTYYLGHAKYWVKSFLNKNALQASTCSSMNKCNMFNSWMARKCSPRCWRFRLRDLCSLPKMRQWQNVKNFFTSVHPISAGVIWFWSSKPESHLMKPTSSWQTLSWWARNQARISFALKSAKRLQCRGHSSGL